MNNNKLIVLLGPTGVGKTDISIELAKYLNSSIISADSRQIFREIPIGTAAVNEDIRKELPHYFVGSHSIVSSYCARNFEDDVLSLLPKLFLDNDLQLMTGGSMMYIDAVCNGIDYIPDIKHEVRRSVYEQFQSEGLSNILSHLKELDPVYYNRVDKNNYKRVIHGYEICISSGKPYSSFLTGKKQKRDFEIIKIGINREREDLYKRINRRVDMMIDLGLEEECRNVYHLRHLNSLNTVGYKEMFLYFDGIIPYDKAIQMIKRNSRIYARKQLTWWKRDKDIIWIHPDNTSEIYKIIDIK